MSDLLSFIAEVAAMVVIGAALGFPLVLAAAGYQRARRRFIVRNGWWPGPIRAYRLSRK